MGENKGRLRFRVKKGAVDLQWLTEEQQPMTTVDYRKKGKNGLDLIIARNFNPSAPPQDLDLYARGWRFALPWIEWIGQENKTRQMGYLLHLEDGRTLPLNQHLDGYQKEQPDAPRILKTFRNVILYYADHHMAVFDLYFRIAFLRNAQGNRITFQRAEDGRICKIIDTDHRALLFLQEGNQLRLAWEDSGEQVCGYSLYRGKLKSFTDQAGKQMRYRYAWRENPLLLPPTLYATGATLPIWPVGYQLHTSLNDSLAQCRAADLYRQWRFTHAEPSGGYDMGFVRPAQGKCGIGGSGCSPMQS